MKCYILHESKGRMRIHLNQYHMTMEQAEMLETYLYTINGVTKAKVSERTMNAIVLFQGSREALIDAFAGFHYEDIKDEPDIHGRQLNHEYEEKIYWHVARRIVNRLLLPPVVREAVTIIKAVPFIFAGLKTLLKGKMEVSVLDAVTISVSMAQRDFSTASSIIFLLGLSEILEEWTHRKTVDDLAKSMSLNIDKVWMRCADGQEVLVDIRDINQEDEIIVHTGNTIPLDGIVKEGDINVNQSSMTGESVAVHKKAGDYVYAGTVVEEGNCSIIVKAANGKGRYDKIVRMIEESEKMKSDVESKAVHLADSLVPYSFLGTLAVYLCTRNLNKAMAVLMVDYSCALKLSMPISVLSAMKESAEYRLSVKGGKFLEKIHEADTIVFDKTGTLTYSRPHVHSIEVFDHHDPDEMLRLAACLEEHFPHSIANAVVKEAERRNLIHEEKHSKVEYVVAHGIASSIDGQKVVIGSYHFIFEDEKCIIPQGEEERFNSLPEEYSHLHLAIGGRLAAVILIEDAIRPEAAYVIQNLRKKGIRNIVLMTGDSYRTAEAVAKMVGIEEFYAEVLPEEKAEYIRKEHAQGRKVIMLGDGINDSVALSEADCGIAVSDGAAIAREIADVTIGNDNLYDLLTLKDISDAAMQRINNNYRFIMSFNTALILLGVFGVITPALAAYLHNTSTLAISMYSMTNLLSEKERIS